MNDANTVPPVLSVGWRILFGIVLPVLVLVAVIFVLLASAPRGGEKWGYRWLGLLGFSLYVVPSVILLNCWLLCVRWQKCKAAFLAGMPIAAIAAIWAVLYFYGPACFR